MQNFMIQMESDPNHEMIRKKPSFLKRVEEKHSHRFCISIDCFAYWQREPMTSVELSTLFSDCISTQLVLPTDILNILTC